MLKLPRSIPAAMSLVRATAHSILLLAISLCLLTKIAMPPNAHAVLIATGDGTGNTTAPPADPGFANVGIVNGLTGVYLRNGWVITANHVGEQPITLLGVTYDPVPGSRVQFQNPDLTFADLIVFKLQTKPPLPDLEITDSAPSFNTLVTLIGNGRNRGSATTFSGANGWAWGPGRTLRWGTNRIAIASDFVLNTQSFRTEFEDVSGPPGQHEADLVTGDSGGGAFTGSGATAELLGIMFARAPFVGQPTGTSIYGNFGIVVDLFAYRAEILAVVDQPDCSDGLDNDGDGFADFPNDPGCADALDSDEHGPDFECDNGIDDDGDGNIDFPDDDGCQGPTDDSEFVEMVPTGLLGAGVLAFLALGAVVRATAPSGETSDTNEAHKGIRSTL